MDKSDWIHIANNDQALREVAEIFFDIKNKLDCKNYKASEITEAAITIWKARKAMSEAYDQ